MTARKLHTCIQASVWKNVTEFYEFNYAKYIAHKFQLHTRDFLLPYFLNTVISGKNTYRIKYELYVKYEFNSLD